MYNEHGHIEKAMHKQTLDSWQVITSTNIYVM